MTLIIPAALATLAIVLLYRGRPYWAWVAPGAIGLAWPGIGSGQPADTPYIVVAVTFIILSVIFGLPGVRAPIVSRLVMRVMRSVLPRIGETERIALEAGTVWLDGDLFSGAPDWRKLLDFDIQTLSEKEHAFLAGPVDELCAMLDEWTITRIRDLPPDVWAHLKRHGYFGMIIPEAHGGLGFSAAGHSAVIMKIASRSITAAVTVMVPNSLGPAELLLHYGTEKQRALSSAIGARRGDSVLRPHRTRGRQRRGRDPERGHRVPRRVRGQRRARHAAQLAQTLYHAGARVASCAEDVARAGREIDRPAARLSMSIRHPCPAIG